MARERERMRQWISADRMNLNQCQMQGDSIAVELSMQVRES